MITRKPIIFGILLMLVTTVCYGQRRPDKGKIRSLKIAFITERLNLSAKEAQAFWPIYNAHDEQMEIFRERERIEIYDKLRHMEALSEKEVNALLEKYMDLETEKQAANEKFLKGLRNVISAKKTFLLLKTENGFKRRLLKQYHHTRGRQ